MIILTEGTEALLNDAPGKLALNQSQADGLREMVLAMWHEAWLCVPEDERPKYESQ